MSNYVVIRSKFIASRQEAVDYYAARIAGTRTITCHGREVVVIFPADGTHLFSEDASHSDIPAHERVVRRVAGGRTEVRRFSLERAVLLDEVASAIANFTVSVPGTGADGREKRMLHGPALADGRYLRVVLRPGPNSWTIVSAYPIDLELWRQMVRAKRAKFPP